MAIKFQYNKTSLQQLEKQLKVRVRTLPIIKNKESALRMEVKRCKADAAALDARLEKEIQAYEAMFAQPYIYLWKFYINILWISQINIFHRLARKLFHCMYNGFYFFYSFFIPGSVIIAFSPISQNKNGLFYIF